MAVALPRVDERVVGGDAALHDVGRAVELAGLLDRARDRDTAVAVVAARQPALGHLRSDAGRSEERGDARAAGTQPLGERALRRQLHLELTGQVLARELLVVTHVRTDGSSDAALLEQHTQTEAVGPTVVAHRLEVGGALVEKRADEDLRHSDQAEPADGDRRAVRHVCDGLGRCGNDFVHHGGQHTTLRT